MQTHADARFLHLNEIAIPLARHAILNAIYWCTLFINGSLTNQGGFYPRSTATWNFSLENGDYYIPVGIGVIPVSDKVTMNAFIGPQYTVFNHGAGSPAGRFSGARTSSSRRPNDDCNP